MQDSLEITFEYRNPTESNDTGTSNRRMEKPRTKTQKLVAIRQSEPYLGMADKERTASLKTNMNTIKTMRSGCANNGNRNITRAILSLKVEKLLPKSIENPQEIEKVKIKQISEPKSNILVLLACGIRNAKAVKIHSHRDRNESGQDE